MSIHDLGFLKWVDAYGKYEKAPYYERGIKEEQAILNDTIKSLPTKDLDRWSKEFSRFPEKYEVLYSEKWADHIIDVRPDDRYIPTIEINIKDGRKQIFKDIQKYGTTDKYLWFISDSSDDKQEYSLFIYDTHIKLKKEVKKVGETAVSDKRNIFYTHAETTFWFNKIYKLNETLLKTLIYEEQEEKYILSLTKPKYQDDIFILRKSAIYQDLGLIEKDKVKWLDKGFGTKLPINRELIAYDKYFSNKGTKILYPVKRFLEEVFLINDDLYFIFTHDIYNSLYLYNGAWLKILEPSVCEIKLLDSIDSVFISEPHKPGTILKINKTTTHIYKQLEGPTFKIDEGKTPVPWFSVSDKRIKQQGIVFYCYGSFGTSVRKSQQRLWIPWIKQGFTVAFIAIRGGRENGDDWWDQSRTSIRRINGVNDFIVSVKHLQKDLGFNSKNTIIYGRSAGGFLVAAAATQLMNDIAIVYAAKPYTDILRTTSDPTMEGTLQETDEFGLATNPVDFSEILKISPQENIVKDPARNPAVLLTCGLHDPAVPLQGPLKYAKALRDSNWKDVYLRVEKEGHFTLRNNEQKEAEDAALCEYLIKRGA